MEVWKSCSDGQSSPWAGNRSRLTSSRSHKAAALGPWKSERDFKSKNRCDRQQWNVSFHPHHHHHPQFGFWGDYFRWGRAMGENQTPGKPDAAQCLFSVSTIRSLPVSVLILDRVKQHLDLLQLLFTEGDFLWLPYIYIACSGFQFACYEITLLDSAARWRLG